MSTPSLRPLRVGELLDAAITVFLGNARVLMLASACVVVPLGFISAIVIVSAVGGQPATQVTLDAYGHSVRTLSAAQTSASAVSELVILLATGLTTAACVKAISDAYLGQEPDVGSSLRFAVGRLLALLGLQIVSVLVLLIGFVLLVVPGLWLYVPIAVATPVLLIERRGSVASLRRAIRLARGRWWPTAGALLVATSMTLLLNGILILVLRAIFLPDSPSVGQEAFVSLISVLVSGVLLQPFAAAVHTVIYYDLRVRREGYDAQILAEQLGLPEHLLPAAGPPGE